MNKRWFKLCSRKHIQLGTNDKCPNSVSKRNEHFGYYLTVAVNWRLCEEQKVSKIKVKFRWNNIMFNFIPLISWGNFGFWTCYSKYLSFPHILGRISLNLQWRYLMTNKPATGELWIELAPCKFRKYLHTAKSEERPTLQLKFKIKLKFI